MRVFPMILASALALGSAASATAQIVEAQQPQSVVSALQAAGYQAEMLKDDDGDPMVKSSSSGKQFLILFFGCTEHAACSSLQFYTGFSKTPTGLDKINAWNDDKRFGRASIDKEGDPVIRMDVDADYGGMSARLFRDHIDIWVAVVNKFAEHIGAVDR